MLQSGTVEKATYDLLVSLMQEPLLQSTRLVGGTSLALQLGHRKSTDLDLFTFEVPDIQGIIAMLEEKFGYTAQLITGKTTIGFIGGVKIDVIYHPYHWLEDAIVDGDVRLATIGDISAMKMHAITNSGNRPKDFVDIAYLSQYYSYNQIKSMALEKYPMYDPIMFDRAVIYFGDVNTDAIDQIKMLHSKMNWSKIERRIIDMTNYPDKVFTKSPI